MKINSYILPSKFVLSVIFIFYLLLSPVFSSALIRPPSILPPYAHVDVIPKSCVEVTTQSYADYVSSVHLFLANQEKLSSSIITHLENMIDKSKIQCDTCLITFEQFNSTYSPCFDNGCLDNIDIMTTNSVDCQPDMCFDDVEAKCKVSCSGTFPPDYLSCPLCKEYRCCLVNPEDFCRDMTPFKPSLEGYMHIPNLNQCVSEFATMIDLCKVDGGNDYGFTPGTNNVCTFWSNLVALNQYLNTYRDTIIEMVPHVSKLQKFTEEARKENRFTSQLYNDTVKEINEILYLLNNFNDKEIVRLYQKNMTNLIKMIVGKELFPYTGFHGDLQYISEGYYSDLSVIDASVCLQCGFLSSMQLTSNFQKKDTLIQDENFDFQSAWEKEGNIQDVEKIGLYHHYLPGIPFNKCSLKDECLFFNVTECYEHNNKATNYTRSTGLDLRTSSAMLNLFESTFKEKCIDVCAGEADIDTVKENCICEFERKDLSSDILGFRVYIKDKMGREVSSISQDEDIGVYVEISNFKLESFQGVVTISIPGIACSPRTVHVSTTKEFFMCNFTSSESKLIEIIGRLNRDGILLSEKKSFLDVSNQVSVLDAYFITSQRSESAKIGESAKAVVKLVNFGNTVKKVIVLRIKDAKKKLLTEKIVELDISDFVIVDTESITIPNTKSISMQVKIKDNDIDLSRFSGATVGVSGKAFELQPYIFFEQRPQSVVSDNDDVSLVVKIKNNLDNRAIINLDFRLTKYGYDEVKDTEQLTLGARETVLHYLDTSLSLNKGKYDFEITGQLRDTFFTQTSKSKLSVVKSDDLNVHIQSNYRFPGCEISYDCYCNEKCTINILKDLCLYQPTCLCTCT